MREILSWRHSEGAAALLSQPRCASLFSSFSIPPRRWPRRPRRRSARPLPRPPGAQLRSARPSGARRMRSASGSCRRARARRDAAHPFNRQPQVAHPLGFLGRALFVQSLRADCVRNLQLSNPRSVLSAESGGAGASRRRARDRGGGGGLGSRRQGATSCSLHHSLITFATTTRSITLP